MNIGRSASTVALTVVLLLAVTGLTFAQTVDIDHDLGTTSVPLNPQRIVVFDYGVLDSLEQLGVDVVGLPKDTLPKYLSSFADDNYANAGTLQEPDFEAVNRLKPDLIIISARMSAHYDQLKRLAPTLYMAVDNDDYVRSVQSNLRTLGRIFEKEDAVEGHLTALNDRINAVRTLGSDKNALILLITGGRANAYGLGSRYGFVHDDLGITPVDPTISASTHGQVISWEYVLVHDPDLLFVVDRDAVVSGGGDRSAKQVVENELVKFTKAYTAGNITYLEPSYWYLSGGGLSSFNMMLDDLEAALERAAR